MIFVFFKKKVRRCMEKEWDRADEAWNEAMKKGDKMSMAQANGAHTAILNLCYHLGINFLHGRRVQITDEGPFKYDLEEVEP